MVISYIELSSFLLNVLSSNAEVIVVFTKVVVVFPGVVIVSVKVVFVCTEVMVVFTKVVVVSDGVVDVLIELWSFLLTMSSPLLCWRCRFYIDMVVSGAKLSDFLCEHLHKICCEFY